MAGLFTPLSGDVGGGRLGSGGCVAERARVPGRFVIATEAVVCRRWSVRALVRTEIVTPGSRTAYTPSEPGKPYSVETYPAEPDPRSRCPRSACVHCLQLSETDTGTGDCGAM